jgi:diacylglycerol kinase family enzyme
LRFIGVFNRDGGTFRTTDMTWFCGEAERILAAQGHTLLCHVVAGKQIIGALERAAHSGEADVLLAGGGDGTVSSAADIAFRSGVTLAVLPGGTMNLFARSLQLPLTPLGALEAIAKGEVKRVDIATANGRSFVHQFGVGIHPRLVRIRDGMTYHSRIGKMLAGVRAVAGTIVSPPDFETDLVTGKGLERRRTSGVVVSNNPLGEGHVPHADQLDQGVLGVYVADPMSTPALARLLVQVMLGRWKASPLVTEAEVREVTLRFPRRKRSAQAVIDGELIHLEKEVVLKVHPKALKVMVPV